MADECGAGLVRFLGKPRIGGRGSFLPSPIIYKRRNKNVRGC